MILTARLTAFVKAVTASVMTAEGAILLVEAFGAISTANRFGYQCVLIDVLETR